MIPEFVLKDQMFDIKLLEKFYTLTGDDSDSSPDVDEEVKSAYMMFIGDLVPVISFNWKQYIKSYVKGLYEPTYLKNNLTVSDEAYTHWLIKRYLPGIVDDIKNNKPIGNKGRKGPHLTNIYKNEYMQLFRMINEMRNPSMDAGKHQAYKYYEKLFFDSFFSSKGMKSVSSNTISHGTSQDEQGLVLEVLHMDKQFQPIIAPIADTQTRKPKKKTADDSSTTEASEVGLQADV